MSIGFDFRTNEVRYVGTPEKPWEAVVRYGGRIALPPLSLRKQSRMMTHLDH